MAIADSEPMEQRPDLILKADSNWQHLRSLEEVSNSNACRILVQGEEKP